MDELDSALNARFLPLATCHFPLLTMQKQTEQSLAKSLETSPDFLPYSPQLLVDLWDLGCSPDQIVEVVGELNLPPEKTRILDLGCGKGALSVTLASKFGFKVTGIDACKPFLEAAAAKAKEHQVSHLCRFEFGDIRDCIQTERDFDVVIYASMGDVLGDYREIVKRLRRMVHPGGYMIIDDGFFKTTEPVVRKGYEYCLPREQTLQLLESRGDRLIREVMVPDETTHATNYGYLERIKQRANDLITRHPELEHAVLEYIANQEAECEFLDRYIGGAVWLLQVSGD